MKIEQTLGGKTVYSTVIDGRTRRATTAGGPEAAERICAIMRSQNGVAKSAPVAQDLAPTPRSR